MIARLCGELVEKGENYVVVLVGGVGYQVFIHEGLANRLPPSGSKIDLYTRQHVRENEVMLFGFESAGERQLFDHLVTVARLGPKLALSLLATLGEEGTVTAILKNDWKTLTSAPGVGARLAQRVCMEVVDKVRADVEKGILRSGMPSVKREAVEALVSLGHKRAEAERAVALALEEVGETTVESLIPIALKYAQK
jgi:Holliday junction DNA helicase RuvA